MQANVTGSNLMATQIISNTEAAFILSRIGGTGTNALVLQKAQVLLEEGKIKYTGNGVFQYTDGREDPTPALILDTITDAKLISELEKKSRASNSDPTTFEKALENLE